MKIVEGLLIAVYLNCSLVLTFVIRHPNVKLDNTAIFWLMLDTLERYSVTSQLSSTRTHWDIKYAYFGPYFSLSYRYKNAKS